MTRKHVPLGAMLPAAVLALCLHAGLVLSADAKKETAPEFTLKTFDKGEIRLADLQGRPVVLKFMASW